MYQDSESTVAEKLSGCSPVKLEAPTVTESSKCKPITTAPASASANPFAHTLSGTFSNCTIHEVTSVK